MSQPEHRRNYTVRLDDDAVAELNEIIATIAADSPMDAQAWLDGFWRLVDGLGDFTVSYGYARENGHTSRELRQVMHHSHRVVYTINDDRRNVQVLHIWHAARQDIPTNRL